MAEAAENVKAAVSRRRGEKRLHTGRGADEYGNDCYHRYCTGGYGFVSAFLCQPIDGKEKLLRGESAEGENEEAGCSDWESYYKSGWDAL